MAARANRASAISARNKDSLSYLHTRTAAAPKLSVFNRLLRVCPDELLGFTCRDVPVKGTGRSLSEFADDIA